MGRPGRRCRQARHRDQGRQRGMGPRALGYGRRGESWRRPHTSRTLSSPQNSYRIGKEIAFDLIYARPEVETLAALGSAPLSLMAVAAHSRPAGHHVRHGRSCHARPRLVSERLSVSPRAAHETANVRTGSGRIKTAASARRAPSSAPRACGPPSAGTLAARCDRVRRPCLRAP
jgi:hypothetical protein